jgi:UDP-N-acetylmuramoyl-tripeptide--D-alanyl-D-alanine ligase
MLTLKDVVLLTRGELVSGDFSQKITSVSTDTRSIKKGSLFVALKGKNFDGHKFISAAIQKGAAALLVSNRSILGVENVPVIYVRDTLLAYGDLARGYRERFDIPVVAITGSAGKTTTKELTAKVLSSKYCVLKNYQTENNEIGVSKTLLNLRPKHTLAVLELGTNHFGEIKRLTSIVKPTTVVLTNIGESHLEFLKNRQGVFREKSAIYKNLSVDGTILYNSDDDLLKKIGQQEKKPKKVTFAFDQKADYCATDIDFQKKSLSFFIKKKSFALKTLSRENIYNALAAIALGRLFGLSWRAIRTSLACVSFPKGRQHILNVSGVSVIDDTYNANPTSVAAALSTLSRFLVKGKKIFVFGDMRELGSVSRQAHEKMGRLSAEHKIDILITYGEWTAFTARVAKAKGIFSIHCKTHEDVVNALRKNISRGDVVLVKGSRGMQMDTVVDKIKSLHF